MNRPAWLRLLRLLLLGALLSPACCFAGVIAEEDGGGAVDGSSVAAAESATPFEIGDTAMVVQGTSFVSSVDSSHARVPTPDGATEGSLFIMVSQVWPSCAIHVQTNVDKLDA